jgi:TIR domain
MRSIWCNKSYEIFTKWLVNSDAPWQQKQEYLPPVQVFITYAREDLNAVKRLYSDLKENGLDPWLDKEEILPGQSWLEEIKRAISYSRYTVVLISSNLIASGHDYLQREIKYAMQKQQEIPGSFIFIIHARLDDSDIPFSMLIFFLIGSIALTRY